MPATEQKSYYDILGVSENASKADIRRAYLELAKKYHPDKTGGDKAAEERLKEINAAYDTLKNDEKRKQYDAKRRNPFGGGGAPGFGGAEGYGPEGFSFSFEGGGLGDIFEGLFGGGGLTGGRPRARHASRPGNDLEIALDISLREAAQGARKTIRINRRQTCAACRGTGSAGGAPPETCPDCEGRGQVQRGGVAVFMAQTCRRCGGMGLVVTTPCASCGGQGHVREPNTIRVNIPAGASDGTRLRLQGQGDAGQQGARAGDLYVKVRVAHDPVFTREGDQLRCEVPVCFTTAALGGKVRVPTLGGQAELEIPAGTSSGKVFRLRGQGMPHARGGGKGDLLVSVQITVPKRLTPEQRRLVEELDKTLQ